MLYLTWEGYGRSGRASNVAATIPALAKLPLEPVLFFYVLC